MCWEHAYMLMCRPRLHLVWCWMLELRAPTTSTFEPFVVGVSRYVFFLSRPVRMMSFCWQCNGTMWVVSSTSGSPTFWTQPLMLLIRPSSKFHWLVCKSSSELKRERCPLTSLPMVKLSCLMWHDAKCKRQDFCQWHFNDIPMLFLKNHLPFIGILFQW